MNFVGSGLANKRRAKRFPSTDLSDVACPERIMVLGQLTAGLSHEMAQPLSSALNYLTVAADRCRQNPDLDPVVVESVISAQGQVERAIRISRHVRRFAVDGTPLKESFDLHRLLQACVDEFEKQGADKATHVRLELTPRSVPVVADPVLVQQVVMNLLKNALEAMEHVPEPDRLVAVSSTIHDGHQARVSISDQGPGLPRNDNLMAQPFLTSKPDGMGLGLWLCRTMIEANKGKFWAEKNAAGGATFFFTLPLADGANQWKS